MSFFSGNITRKLFLFWAILFILFYLLVYAIEQYNNEDQIAKRFQTNFLEQQATLNKKIPEVISILEGEEEQYWPKLERLLNDERIITLIFSKDSLAYWNSNKIQLDLDDLKIEEGNAVISIQTGWYLTIYQNYKSFQIFLFKEIKSEYSVSNAYLPVAVQSAFSNYENINLTLDTLSTESIIFDQNDKAVLGLIIPQPISLSNSGIVLLFSLFVLIYLLFLFWIGSIYKKFEGYFKNRWLLYLFFILDVIILRSLDYYFDFPLILKESFLFEINPMGLTGFASVGDVLLNAVLILFVVFRWFNNTKRQQNISPRISIISIVFLWIFSIALFYFIFHIVSQIPYSSHFGTLFYSIESLGYFIAIVLLLAALFILIVTFSQHLKVTISVLLWSILIAVSFSVLVYFSFFDDALVLIVSTIFLLMNIILLFFSKENHGLSTEMYLIMLVVIATATALIVNQSDKIVRDNHQLDAVSYLGHSHETKLESGYGQIYRSIKQDSVVNRIVMNGELNQEEELAEYLKDNYFTRFLNKYDIQITLCEWDEELEIQPDNVIINCNDYFHGLIDDYGESTEDSTLFLLNTDPESIYYVGDIKFEDSIDSLNQHLYIEFFYTIVPQGLGYPELLVDHKYTDVDLSAYSFAWYENDNLAYKFGNFAYHTDFQFLHKFPDQIFFSYLKYRHYKIEISPGSFLVVSRPNMLITERISAFSVFFIVLGFTLFVIILFLFGRKNDSLFYSMVFGFNFQKRLQIIFTGSIAFIIILLAVITMYYVRSNNEKNLRDQLNEKTYSVLIELQHKLSGEAALEDYNEEMLYQLLRKFSMVFFSDINLYNTSGQLIATSRPEIFEKGLLSKNINPLAFEELFVDNKLFYLTEEKIGTLAYYSSYVPLVLDGNKPQGIINLPYFARQNEVQHAYNQMLFTYVNLFVILGIIGIFIALILSKVLTRPLKVIQQSLANIRIDKQNEKIEWNKNDEIGKLVEEYNRMVDKLEQSAELLKHSERESAWREVARQIAHEIKNPLTPMKLNVQYLEKAYRENDPDFGKKVKNISNSLIEQIESLNSVAEMFADFSKTTTQNLTEVDLIAIINSSVELFKNNRDVKISIKTQDKTAITLASADGNDILRVFNNLIKNSIQSLTGAVAGKIDITIDTKMDWHIVTVSDNGKGIDDETKTRIFQPYFTTKSTGTGLGLAIVKSIMSGIGGEIEFESQPGIGSKFTLKFKAIK